MTATDRFDIPPPSGIHLRATEPRDAAGLTLLSNQASFRWGTLRKPFQSEEATRQWLTSGGENRLLLLALEGETVVASGGLHRFEGRRQHAAELGMGVASAWQRRGIGRALLAALLDSAFNWLQIRRVELHVYIDNHSAIALYERFGFEREGHLLGDGFRDGAYVDVFAMAKHIDPSVGSRPA
ncbi:hypothetical protein BJF93_20665 [Xaviernesmea oryzae]|uniref:N-acetyltransferase domain-containing protein n=1 Tax=Xaviernesmea oryzae TaxID=464029 RepID=A0A1Q9AZP3_9HYPH|nr:GNAT family N-acetyltransferase [Xaviernesmea oryzae]OLP61207.1 hypothetical protein BJF93_20665 [Xaviernesmea oryzae]SEL50345.1 putative acetyltransferase [Xaviernesmea oryzae]